MSDQQSEEFSEGFTAQEAPRLQETFGVRAEPVQEVPFERVEQLQPVEQGRARVQPFEEARVEQLQPVEQGRAPLQPFEQDGVTPARLTPRVGTVVSPRPASINAQGQQSGGGGGGAGQGFQVDVDQYRSAVSPVLEAADQVTQLATRLSAYLSSAEGSSPWGDDESGKQFSEGEKGYLKYSKDTQSGLKTLGEGLKGVSDGLKAMADGYENSEQSLTGGFDAQGGGGGQVGATAPPAYSAPLPTMPYNLRPTTGKH
ncbi:hypothetical protein [Kitasatospora sp. McL0602]|uniref:hypothetical protein n=1 Tax=Kitasatospora sp. McL0602 TaxID=3439530 RepID=UPI003F89CA2E